MTMRLLVIVSLLFSSSLYAQDAREIIHRYLDTVSNGNINNWNKIKSTYVESEVYYSQRDFNQKFTLAKPDKSNFHKSYSIFPYNNKIEIYEDSSLTKLQSTFYFLKDRTIVLLGNVPPLIKQPQPRDEFYSDHLPVQISKLVGNSKSVELLGTKEFPLDGLVCYEIKITAKKRKYVLYINTETFLLEYWNGRDDGDMSILSRFTNYKKVDSFLIPMSNSTIKDGVPYFSTVIRKYIINSDIEPKIFNYYDK
jgi:hypothetical protein